MQVVDAAIAALVELFRRALGDSVFRAAEQAMVRLGAFAAVVAAACGFGLGLYLSVKSEETTILFIGIAWVFAVAVMHYIGARMLTGCRVTLSNAPTNISSVDYLEVLGLCSILLFVGALVAGLYLAVKTSNFDYLWYGLGFSMVALAFASMYLNPSIINAKVKPSASAGEDAIAISALTLKTFIRLAPMVFSLLTLAGGVALGWSALKLMKQDSSEMFLVGLASFSGFGLVALGLLYPLISYLVFVTGYLVLDMARSILMISRIAAVGAVEPVVESAVQVSEDAAQLNAVQVVKLKTLLLVVCGALVLGTVAIQGKKYYAEYQQRVEMERIEAERLAAEKKAAEELAQKEETAKRAEVERVEKIARAATAMKGQSSIDLLMQPLVSEGVRAILGDQVSVFEQYFAEVQPVQVEGNYVIGTGCMMESCGTSEGIFVIDTEKGTVHAAVVYQGRIQILGDDTKSTTPPPIRKWVIRFQ